MLLCLIRFLLMLKAKLKSPFTYVWILLMALALWLVRESAIPLEKPSEVLILNEAGECGSKVVRILQSTEGGHSAYVFSVVEDEEEMREAVRRGQALCGFIFPKDMGERFSSENSRGMITMVTSVFSLKAPAVRETVFAAVYRVVNADIIEESEDILFEDPDLVKDYIRERYEYFTESSEVFGLEYEEIETKAQSGSGFLHDSSDPLRGTAAVLIFILCLYSANAFRGADGRFFRALPKTDRAVSFIMYELASAFVPALCGFVMIRTLDPEGVPLTRELVCFAVFLIFSCIWSAVFSSFFRKSEVYLPAVSVLLFMSLAICPVYFDIARYIPVMKYVTGILPPALYLYLL